MTRAHNFSAGPAVLPLEVIQELQAALPNYNNIGLGLMEMSHRSKDFDEIITSAENRLRNLLNIPADYEVLFLQGGASLQFYMTALNMLTPKDTGAYINTGTWSTKAIKEAKRCANVSTIWEPQMVYSLVFLTLMTIRSPTMLLTYITLPTTPFMARSFKASPVSIFHSSETSPAI